MPFETVANFIDKQGMGAASFVVLIYATWQILAFLQKLAENHLQHVQESLDSLVKLSEENNAKLDKVIEQTKK